MSDNKIAVCNPIYAVQRKEWDNHNYPCWTTKSRWSTIDTAYEELSRYLAAAPGKMQIIKETLYSFDDGRVGFGTNLVVLDEDDVWHPLYDPRKSDPEWSTYVRLKEKFDG